MELAKNIKYNSLLQNNAKGENIDAEPMYNRKEFVTNSTHLNFFFLFIFRFIIFKFIQRQIYTI